MIGKDNNILMKDMEDEGKFDLEIVLASGVLEDISATLEEINGVLQCFSPKNLDWVVLIDDRISPREGAIVELIIQYEPHEGILLSKEIPFENRKELHGKTDVCLVNGMTQATLKSAEIHASWLSRISNSGGNDWDGLGEK